MGAWLLLLAMQALQRPFDGYMPAHVGAPGGSLLSGPLLAIPLACLLPLAKLQPELRFAHLILLAAVPLFSIVAIDGFMRTGAASPGMRRIGACLIGVVLLLTAAATGDFPYLSNDVYLYRAQGQMLNQAGASPYATAPAEVLPPGQLQNVPWTHQKCAYGPLALDGFRAATAGRGGIVGDFWRLKLLLALPLFAMLLLLARLPQFDARERIAWFAWIGLNPLILLDIAQNAHLEGWIGLFLALLLLALDHTTLRRVIAAGVLCGLACAIKLSLLVVAPIAVVWLWTGGRARVRRAAVVRTALFALASGATLVALYFPYWQGWSTLDGLQWEAAKVIRSFHAMLGALFGMSPGWIQLCSLGGNLLAMAAGAWVCCRRSSLAQGVLACLLVQAVLGRTFLQPWHFCPALMLIPFLGMATRAAPAAANAAVPGTLTLTALRGFLILSVSSLVGGYALLFLIHSRADVWQVVSFLCMVLPPLTWWSVVFLLSARPTALS